MHKSVGIKIRRWWEGSGLGESKDLGYGVTGIKRWRYYDDKKKVIY